MEKISIVVPVYNTKRELLERCVNSLVNQTYNNVEIILVDDGSTLDIKELCDNYEKKYSNIIVVHKSNGGLSSARNAGQDQATGRWLMFVDSDDWIDCNTCEELISLTTRNHDKFYLIVFGFVNHFGNKFLNCFFDVDSTCCVSNKNYFLVKTALSYPSLLSSSCWKVFDLSFLKTHCLRHNETVRQGSEDLEFMIRFLTKVDSIVIFRKRFYHYSMNPDSITNSFNLNNAYAVQSCFIEIKKTLVNLNNAEIMEMYYVRAWYALCASLVSGFMNPSNGIKFKEKKKLAIEYMSTDFSKSVIKNVNFGLIGIYRRVVFLFVKYNFYMPIYIIAFLRGLQKRRL